MDHRDDDGLLAELRAVGSLDRLARELLGPNDPDIVFPARWLTEHFGEARADPDVSVGSERRPRPPLRRWAADRCLRRRVVAAGQALKIARRLCDDHRWALIAGGLDAAEALAERDVECFIDAALSSGEGPLRLRGLRLLADRGDRERAVERARSDGDAKVRGWTRQQEQQDQGAERDAVRGAGGSR